MKNFLALRLREGSERAWLRIDALCINQEDNAEKSGQVGRMSDIPQRLEE